MSENLAPYWGLIHADLESNEESFLRRGLAVAGKKLQRSIGSDAAQQSRWNIGNRIAASVRIEAFEGAGFSNCHREIFNFLRAQAPPCEGQRFIASGQIPERRRPGH